MIILNEAQIKAWDAYTIAKGISSLALMEQAAVAVSAVSYTHLDVYKRQSGEFTLIRFSGAEKLSGPAT